MGKKKTIKSEGDESTEPEMTKPVKTQKSKELVKEEEEVEKLEEEVTPRVEITKKEKKKRKLKESEDGVDQISADESNEKKKVKPSGKEKEGPFTAYLSGFPYDTDIQSFVQTNTPNAIDVRIHTWHDSGKSRGCAHVDYPSKSDLEEGIQILNNKTVGTRYVSAVQAESKNTATAPPVEEDGSRSGRKLFVKNLPYEVTEQQVLDFFKKFGNIKQVRLPQWNHTSNKKGFGYVEFEQKAFAVSCVKTHRETPLNFSGRTLILDYDQGRPKQGFKTETGRAWYKGEDSKQKKSGGGKRS